MAILDFSVSGWHGFGSVTQVCFGISVSNFMCMSFVAVGRSLTIVSYVAFKMAALWFWTMFNCNPPIAHCHPLLWGGGILVDHWSTISSFNQSFLYNVVCPNGAGTINTLRPRQDGRPFPDDMFKCIFLKENAWILLNISLNFVDEVRINNIPALVQIMAWRQPGDKPLSEPMMVSLLTHICVTRPQRINYPEGTSCGFN